MLFRFSFLSKAVDALSTARLMHVVGMENFVPSSVAGGKGGKAVGVYNEMKLDRMKGGMTDAEAVASLEELKGDARPGQLVIKDKKVKGGKARAKATAATRNAKKNVYADEVQAKVRRDDASQPLFEVAHSYFPNEDTRRDSLTRILSLRQTNASRAKATAAMRELHENPSDADRRAYNLAHFNLSELVSDLWWTNKRGKQ